MTAEGDARPTVLVVDDDAILRDLVATALQRADFDVVAVADGPGALQVVDARQVDVVVCDIAMPGMSGLDVVRALRQRPETATLPVILITGTSGSGSVIEGLEAGADDFLTKPVRLEELVARVRAHVRTRSAWLDTVGQELRQRLEVVTAVAAIQASGNPEESASAIVAQLLERSRADYACVFQIAGERARLLAAGVPKGRRVPIDPGPARLRSLVERARAGPWSEALDEPEPGEPTNDFWDAGFALVVGAPIFTGERLAGLLVLAFRATKQGISARARDLSLATAIDYASVLGAALGATLLGQAAPEGSRERLQRIIDERSFDVVYQPIIRLGTGSVVGYEALTRFRDRTPPDVRFAEAYGVGLGVELELAAAARAVEHAVTLPSAAFLAINLSPDVLPGSPSELRALLPAGRDVVFEITEHVRVADYQVLRDAVRRLRGVRLAVDDAGAGYASLRHILELQPDFAKLDMSLVRGVGDDRLRQALAAGLVYYASRSGFQLIAEGIEQPAEAETLAGLGVELGQGYLFGRPGPPPRGS